MRNVLVTGGSRGLGLGIAGALAASGFQVVAIARREGNQFPAVREQVNASGTGALHYRGFDLSEIGGIAEFVRGLRLEFGSFYGLVNNAGIGDFGLLSNTPNHVIERLLRVNVLSPIVLTKYLSRSMMTARAGRIVNVSSVVSMTGYAGISVYSASKASLLGFTRSLARELGPLGITVNAVAPGFIDTEMTHGLDAPARTKIAGRSALGRLPEVADVANAVDFLFSDKACNITGTAMTIDAGNTA